MKKNQSKSPKKSSLPPSQLHQAIFLVMFTPNELGLITSALVSRIPCYPGEFLYASNHVDLPNEAWSFHFSYEDKR